MAMKKEFADLLVRLAEYSTPSERCACSKDYIFIEVFTKDSKMKTINSVLKEINGLYSDWNVHHGAFSFNALTLGLKKGKL